MNKTVEGLLYVDSHDSLVRVLQSWRLWILGAIIGAILASGVYALFPPPFRARATVVVDQNLEGAWEYGSRQLFYFLGREARKLEEVAWSDETIQIVADEVGDVTVRELRDEILILSQPEDGAWHFFAEDRDPDRAERIASAWAAAFYHQVLDGIEISADLEREREEIKEVLARNPDISEGDIENLIERISPTLDKSQGISPYIEIDLAQADNLQLSRRVPMSAFILIGSAIGACGAALLALLMLRAKERDAFLAE
jgi:hypothetical protein